MHPNEQLLNKLFQYLNGHDAKGMTDCYNEKAMFEDIAFRLDNKAQIHAMWDMICSANKEGIESDIHVEVKEVSANDAVGRAVVVEDYTYRDTGNNVHNEITSTFEFRDGLIFKQTDECDPVKWANQAFGSTQGFIPGHIEFLRRWKAMKKLKKARPEAFPD